MSPHDSHWIINEYIHIDLIISVVFIQVFLITRQFCNNTRALPHDGLHALFIDVHSKTPASGTSWMNINQIQINREIHGNVKQQMIKYSPLAQ